MTAGQSLDDWVRVPQVSTGGRAGEPVPCPVRCLTCLHVRDGCDSGQACAPICAQARPAPGAEPVHVCIITTHAGGRLVVRRSAHQSTYVRPDGIEIPPAPIAWPLLVVDCCPHCGRVHLHTIQDPGPRWFRRPLNCRPYLVILRRIR